MYKSFKYFPLTFQALTAKFAYELHPSKKKIYIYKIFKIPFGPNSVRIS